MNKLALATILILAAACGDGINPPTFADGATEISEAFCDARTRCGWSDGSDRAECVDRNYASLCTDFEAPWDCDLDLTGEQYEQFQQCAADMRDPDWCGPFLPESCYYVLRIEQ